MNLSNNRPQRALCAPLSLSELLDLSEGARAKIMLFVDGTWLYSNTPRLGEAYGKPEFQVDFGRLPVVLAQQVGRQLGSADVDVVRTYLFGSYASNYDLRDEEPVQRRLDFFSMLKEEFHYEIEIFPITFRGRRLRKPDRDPKDPFEPKEKCVDSTAFTAQRLQICLVVTLVSFGAMLIIRDHELLLGYLGRWLREDYDRCLQSRDATKGCPQWDASAQLADYGRFHLGDRFVGYACLLGGTSLISVVLAWGSPLPKGAISAGLLLTAMTFGIVIWTFRERQRSLRSARGASPGVANEPLQRISDAGR